MDETIKEQWIADLCSGEYVQGQGRLHKIKATYDYSTPQGDKPYTRTVRHEFCCLGVLCEQAVAAGIADRTLIGSEDDGHYAYHPAGTSYSETEEAEEVGANYVPKFIQQWAVLPDENPYVITPDSHVGPYPLYGPTTPLARLNDDVDNPVSFADLARVIERGL